MGHEGAGIVESVGPGVTRVRPGASEEARYITGTTMVVDAGRMLK